MHAIVAGRDRQPWQRTAGVLDALSRCRTNAVVVRNPLGRCCADRCEERARGGSTFTDVDLPVFMISFNRVSVGMVENPFEE
jgi:hypothetical protein